MKTYSIDASDYRDELAMVSGYFSEASALAVIIQNIITGELKVKDKEKFTELYDKYIAGNIKCEKALNKMKEIFVGETILPGCRCYVGFNNGSFNVMDTEENPEIENFLLRKGFMYVNQF